MLINTARARRSALPEDHLMSIPEASTPPHRLARSTGAARGQMSVTVYDPKLLSMMRRAFAAACSELPPVLTSTEPGRQNLARRILAHVDRGERDPRRLAYLAAGEVGEAERVERRKFPAFWEEIYAVG